MKKEKYAYEERVIAFLDILGVKELLKDDQNRSKIFEAVDILSDYQVDKQANFESTFFSDSIVISFPLSKNDKNNLENLRGLVYDVTLKLCARLFLRGILLRGSITSGKLYHKGNIIIGQALVDAYEMESKIAFYPRIILSHKIENLVNMNDVPSTNDVIIATPNGIGTTKITSNYSSTLSIRSSDDGYSYLHWLDWHITQMIEEGQIGNIPIMKQQRNLDRIEAAKQTIEENLDKFKNHPGPFTKWRWIAVYFNQVMVEHNLIKCQVNIESIKPYRKYRKQSRN